MGWICRGFALTCVLVAALICTSMMRDETLKVVPPTLVNPTSDASNAVSKGQQEVSAPDGKQDPVVALPTSSHQPRQYQRPTSQVAGSSKELVAPRDEWRKKLYTPTYITFLVGYYFIVDCWHHRVIYSDRLDAPIAQWIDLDLNGGSMAHKPMKIPHSVATDGTVLVVESSVGGSDGNDHSVLVYHIQPVDGDDNAKRFSLVQEITVSNQNAARRPHRVVFDDLTKAFYVYMTSPPMLTKFIRQDEGVKLVRVFSHSLPFMGGMYARSFALHGGSMYITAGPGAIWQVNYTVATESVGVKQIKAYRTKVLGFQKGKMNDLFFHNGWWYATATVGCGIVRFRDLDAMHKHEKLTKQLDMCRGVDRSATRCTSGTPYFLSTIGERLFVPYIFGCSGIMSFTVDGKTSAIGDVKQHWEGGWVEKKDDVAVRGSEW